MATAQLNRITLHIHRTLATASLGEATDAMLLERFTAQRDEAAFAVLVRRHGPMVLGVCHRVLRNLHDAEDAFQAAFLLLARKAGGIRQRDSLASWLFAVSRRMALKVRAEADRRHAFEDRARNMAPTATNDLPAFDPELRSILDEELGRLPDKYRAALVVCYLEGKTQAAAARQMGWKPGAVRIRLERGRLLLRARLTRRGLALSAGALAATLPSDVGALSPALIDATVQGAMLLGAGQAGLTGVVSERALALLEGMRKTMLLTKLKIATAIFLAVGVIGGGTTWFLQPAAVAQAPASVNPTPPPPAAKKVATDVLGDPLPPGARARLGTLRFRHESDVTFLAYTTDGKYLITATPHGIIRKWDAATGQELLQFGKPPAVPKLGNAKENAVQARMDHLGMRGFTGLALGLSPDGRTLVSGQGDTLTLWEVASGKKIREWKTPSPIVTLAFSPDGKSLVSRDRDLGLQLWDVAEGKEIRKLGKQSKPRQHYSSYAYHGYGGADARIAFSPDGKAVAAPAVEKDQITVVKRWDVANGKELPSVKSPQGIMEFVALAADGKTTGWCGMGTDGEGRLLDLESGKELRKIEGAKSIVAFSPDAKVLVGRTADQGLGLWDVATGKLRHKLSDVSGQVAQHRTINVGNDFGGGENAAFSAHGQRVAVAVGTTVRQWEIADGKEINCSGGHAGTISHVDIAADGKSVLTRAVDQTLRTWDAAGRETRKLPLPAASHAILSADGRILVLASEGTIRLWDTTTGKELRQWKAHDEEIGGLALSADGKLIASRSSDYTICVWDGATGNKLRQIADPGNDANRDQAAAFFFPGFNSSLLGLIFLPDGTTLAELPAYRPRGGFDKDIVNGAINGQAVPKQSLEKSILLLDVATGKLKHRFAETRAPAATGVFSLDGRTLATANTDGTVSLWETLSGRERLVVKSGPVSTLAFAPNGKFLVTGGADGTIRFWDTATGKDLAQRKGHQSRVASLALSADGKTLITGSNDTTALVWDVPALNLDKVAPVNLESAQVEALWHDLAGNDPGKAHQAIRRLSAAPTLALPLLQSHLKSVPVPDPQRIAQLIAELDHRQFATRQKAEEELQKLGELADPALKDVLAGKPALETRQRVEKVREKMFSGQMPAAEVLQALRALAVLEDLDTREARELLDKLSQGAAGARQTREAKAALARLSRNP